MTNRETIRVLSAIGIVTGLALIGLACVGAASGGPVSGLFVAMLCAGLGAGLTAKCAALWCRNGRARYRRGLCEKLGKR